MGTPDKKTVIRDLMELGKTKGQLSTKEILDALGELDFDPEQIEKFYDSLESLGVEIVEDFGEIPIDDITFDIGETAEETPEAAAAAAEGIAIGESEAATAHSLEEAAGGMGLLERTIVEIIPSNPFYAMTGQGANATLSVVLIACLVGIAVIGVRTYEPEQAELFTEWMNALNTLVVEIVMMIIMLTPYGIFSLMTGTVAGSDFSGILKLLKFVLASYSAILAMFAVHAALLAALGLNPLTYCRKALTALTFAFTSRTSAGTLPLTVRTLTEKMGVSGGVANLTASLGVSIGQNGCAAIYPAMLVVMVLPTVGRTMTPGFFLVMVLTITVVSIGIAGVGGGATFAGIMVLSALGLPVGIAGLLIAIEPLIDMGRTALNVSDGMVSALGTARITGNLRKEVYDDPRAEFVDQASGH